MAEPRRILVVDDDPSIRSMVCDMLELGGYRGVPARDGHEALCLVDSDRPDCVVLDVMMPGLSGHAVLRRIREAAPTLPVVMLTAAADDAQAWQSWSRGADYFLAKPFEPTELLRYLDALFGVAIPA